MPESGHKLLSFSSAHRWMACPGAPLYEDKFPRESSEAADEGTALHEVTEACIIGRFSPDRFLDTEKQVGEFTFTINEERIEAVQAELDYFRSIFDPRIHELMVEKKLPATFSTQSGGTADILLNEALGQLHVLDHKYGRRWVSPDAPQLKLYGASALAFLDMGHYEVVTHVGQPRVENFNHHVFKASELLEWVEDEVKPAAEAALEEDAPRVPGDHCMYCKAEGVCPERREKSLAVFETVGDQPIAMTNEALGTLLDQCNQAESFIKKVRAVAFERAQAGNPPDGWKLVHKRTNRQWGDEKKVVPTLISRGVKKSDLYTPGKLKSVAQIEKIVGKNKAGAEVLKGLWEKPVGYTLAKDKDQRAQASTVEDDFKGIDYDSSSETENDLL